MSDVMEGLARRGQAFWNEVQARFEFDAHEEEVLLEACRCMDTIDALAEAVARDGVMISGSQGQLVLNSAVGELRQQQSSLARLLTQLNLDAVEVGQLKSAKQVQARSAAQARWRQRVKEAGIG